MPLLASHLDLRHFSNIIPNTHPDPQNTHRTSKYRLADVYDPHTRVLTPDAGASPQEIRPKP
jgi:hypothetical protein